MIYQQVGLGTFVCRSGCYNIMHIDIGGINVYVIIIIIIHVGRNVVIVVVNTTHTHTRRRSILIKTHLCFFSIFYFLLLFSSPADNLLYYMTISCLYMGGGV